MNAETLMDKPVYIDNVPDDMPTIARFVDDLREEYDYDERLNEGLTRQDAYEATLELLENEPATIAEYLLEIWDCGRIPDARIALAITLVASLM
jgi:hypothetical protein